jgi:hypothetical protein
MRTSFGWVMVSVFGAGAAIFACGDPAATCADLKNCDAPGDGGSDVTQTDSPNQPDSPPTTDGGSDGDSDIADAPPDTAPPGCDVAKDPKDSPPCVADKFGLFVDASKPAGGTGTKASPFNTIGAAIAASATATQKRIYVCAGAYAEKVALAAANDGVNVYGGWACADWSYATTNTVTVKPATGTALEVKSLTTGTTIEDIAFASNDATVAGSSSIAAFVSTSQNITLRRVALTAGKGVAGASGSPATNYSGATSPSGSVPTGGTGGAGGLAVCTVGTSNGGKGGDGVAGATGNGGTGAWNPTGTTVAGRDGNGGLGGPTACATNAFPGADASQVAAAPGSAKLGTLNAAGWTPEPGAKGNTGNPGQGGGGGGGKTSPVTGGAGGGAGGCGGAGGGQGGGGGASIALLSFNAFVKVEASTLTASDAGKGGDGALGQGGQGGGDGALASCSGAMAGNGSGGGGGGGGAGGVSAAIGYVGTAPTADGASTLAASATAAPAGNGKAGGSGGTNALSTAPGGLPGGNGVPGVNTPTKDLS